MKNLLTLARNSILEEFTQGYSLNLNEFREAYKEVTSVFITLYKHNELRGCIGQLQATKPLYINVYEMAKKAAFKDQRFYPVTKDEMEEVTIEISILSPLTAIETLNNIIIGKHGVMLSYKNQTAVFLPEVAYEQQWTIEQLKKALLAKASIKTDIAENDIYYHVFTSKKISEKDLS